MSFKTIHKTRRAIAALILSGAVILTIIANPNAWQKKAESSAKEVTSAGSVEKDVVGSGEQRAEGVSLATELLAKLEVKGRAPKTGYKRTEFYNGWPDIEGCNLRQRILKRDFGETAKVDEKCNVVAGKFYEPYTGEEMEFHSRQEISKQVQIDHVVALSDAWQKGAQYKTADERLKIATDPLNLIAVQAAANQQKSDGDAATWLPPHKSYRCDYVSRQIAVKRKYHLWVTSAERNAMIRVLSTCPNHALPAR